MKTFEIHWKYVYTLEGRDFVNAGSLDQIGLGINMSKTIGVSTVFENDITRKRTFVKINWGYVAFLTAPNPHVCQTIGIVDAGQRCKI